MEPMTLAEKVLAKRLREYDEAAQNNRAAMHNAGVMVGKLAMKVEQLTERVQLLEDRLNGRS
jgi:hypothetical protein